MRKFLVSVQYYGKKYLGFQINGNQNTIQLAIENALFKLFEQKITINGCSRTDAGVSAREYFFVFEADTKLPADRVCFKLNRFLPSDIKCQTSRAVAPDFDLRANINCKTYEYLVYDGNHIQPLLNRFAVFVEGSLNTEQMQACANVLVGKHNFKSFCNINADTKTFVRTIKDIKIVRDGNLVKFYFTADGFLYNMVRIIVGTLIECGKGVYDVNSVEELLQKQDRSANVGKTMISKGLCLHSVELKSKFWVI